MNVHVFIVVLILFPCEVGRYQHKHKTFVCFKADAQIIATKWKKEKKHLLCRCSICVNIVHINNSCVSYSSTVFWRRVISIRNNRKSVKFACRKSLAEMQIYTENGIRIYDFSTNAIFNDRLQTQIIDWNIPYE